MFASRRDGVPRNLLPHRITLGPDSQPLLELPSEKVWPSGKVWPIRRAVLFWVALGIAGWIAIFGLANYLS